MAGKTGELKKLQNLIQNTSWMHNLLPHHATAERENAAEIMTV
jgi:hypothetical protein